MVTAAFLVVGCNEGDKPTEGIVYKTGHQEEKVTYPPLLRWPASWNVSIAADCKDGIPPTVVQAERDCRTNTVGVTQGVFKGIKIGDRANTAQLTGANIKRGN